MQIYQDERSDKRCRKVEVLDILILLWSFPNAFLHMFLYIVNRRSASGQLAIIYILVAIVAGFLFLKYAKRYLPVSALYTLAIFIVIALSFLVTRVRYGTSESIFVSEFKAYYAMMICTYMVSLLIVWGNKTEFNLNLILLADVLLTLICFLALVKGDSLTSGGFVSDSSGMRYQNISYYSAGALGLTMFHVIESKRKGKVPFLQIVIYFVLMLTQLFICFISGGRGGAVLAILLLFYGVIFVYGIKKVYKILLPVVIGVVVILFVFPILINYYNVNVRGLTRVLNLLNRVATDTGRVNLFKKAINVFYSSPIVGHGIGSIFYYIHGYSHNMLSDVLAETGLVGLLALLIVFYLFIKKLVSLYSHGSLYRLMTIIFICGFTLNLFSGYLWVNQQVWFPVAVILMSPRIKGKSV